jgi:membrane protein YdbS with pleckstrin-like domain
MMEEEVFYEGKIHPDWRKKERLKVLIYVILIFSVILTPFLLLWIFFCLFNSSPYPLYLLTSVPPTYNFCGFFMSPVPYISIIFLIVFLIVFILYNSYLKAYIRNFTFQITTNHVIINHGVFRQSRATIPFGRIQNINITSGIFDRKYKLFTVNVETAGTSGYPLRGRRRGYAKAEGYIPGQKEPLIIESKIKERLYKVSKTKNSFK